MAIPDAWWQEKRQSHEDHKRWQKEIAEARCRCAEKSLGHVESTRTISVMDAQCQTEEDQMMAEEAANDSQELTARLEEVEREKSAAQAELEELMEELRAAFQYSQKLLRERDQCSAERDALQIRVEAIAEELIFARGMCRDFIVEEKIGAGSFGRIYRATTLTGDKVAIKGIPADEWHLLEAEILSGLDHPNIVRLRGSWVMQKMGYLIMAMGTPITTEHDPGAVVLDCLRALRYLHRLCLGHCDVKTHNLIDIGGVVQLVDFGCVRRYEGARLEDTVGTPALWTPEQATGFTWVPSRIDCWAVGVVAYHLLSKGHYPFGREDTPELRARIKIQLFEDPSVLASFSDECQWFIGSTLVEENSRASAEELLESAWMKDEVLRHQLTAPPPSAEALALAPEDVPRKSCQLPKVCVRSATEEDDQDCPRHPNLLSPTNSPIRLTRKA